MTKTVECKAHAFRPGEASSYALGYDGKVYAWNPATVTASGVWREAESVSAWGVVTGDMKIRAFSFDIQVEE